MKHIILAVLTVLLLFPSVQVNAEEDKLNIGVTLHPYFSWVSNIVGDTADVTPIIPPESDPHVYQPRPEDLAGLNDIDIIVVNLLGHDSYITKMLKAAGREDIPKINVNDGLSLIPVFHQKYSFDGEEATVTESVSYNSHTYIAITGAIQQVNTIVRELSKRNPEHADLYKKNAFAYARRLRRMLADALLKINNLDTEDLRIATVHDGYAYLFQELGLKTAAVVQPRHGIEPNARQLKDTIDRIKRANANVLFTEVDYKKQYLDIIYDETGCRIYRLSHISRGAYRANKFEQDMQKNLDDIVKAMTDAN